MVYQLRRVLILLALCLGPAWVIVGSILAGRPPEGPEWLDTALLVPTLSVVAAGAVAGVFQAWDWLMLRLRN